MNRILSRTTGINQITNREDLINALTIASQLEHGLMLMYLYAAYSMKSQPAEFAGQPGDPDVLRDKVRNWEGMILRVARQEMEHLGFVCNLLSVIGGPQYFERPNFPQVPKFWGIDLPIELERFCPTSLLRFMQFEKPLNLIDPLFESAKTRLMLAGPQPEDPEYRSIGELYRMIREAFETIPQESLFIVPSTAQVDNVFLFGDGTRPIYNMTLFKTWDRVSAINAIDEIVEQGEGTMTSRPVTPADLDPDCHYMQFRRVYIEYVLDCDPDDEAAVSSRRDRHEQVFEGARLCVRNPALQLHQDTITRLAWQGQGVQPPLSVAIVDHPQTKPILEVANASYEILLQLLIRLYTAVDDTDAERQGILNTAFFPYMTMVIRPLSEVLSRLPAFQDNPQNLTAGSAFEFYRTIGFLPAKPAAWIALHEHMDDTARAFTDACQSMGEDVRSELGLDFIQQNLQRIADDFQTYMGL